MERALQYMNSNRSSANARRMAAPALKGSKALMPAPTEATKIYAFNIEGGGFVIASGDQRTLPVLGYSTTGSIDWSRMPENMRSWLKLYDEAERQGNLAPNIRTLPSAKSSTSRAAGVISIWQISFAVIRSGFRFRSTPSVLLSRAGSVAV